MLAEALVFFACTHGPGCTETSDQYFIQNPQLKKELDGDAQQARRYIGPKIVDTIGPLLFVAAGGKGTVKLNKNWSLQFTKTDGTLSFRVDF